MRVGVRVGVEPQLGVIVDHVERRAWGYISHSSVRLLRTLPISRTNLSIYRSHLAGRSAPCDRRGAGRFPGRNARLS